MMQTDQGGQADLGSLEDQTQERSAERQWQCREDRHRLEEAAEKQNQDREDHRDASHHRAGETCKGLDHVLGLADSRLRYGRRQLLQNRQRVDLLQRLSQRKPLQFGLDRDAPLAVEPLDAGRAGQEANICDRRECRRAAGRKRDAQISYHTQVGALDIWQPHRRVHPSASPPAHAL
jgi:hypothetical protein